MYVDKIDQEVKPGTFLVQSAAGIHFAKVLSTGIPQPTSVRVAVFHKWGRKPHEQRVYRTMLRAWVYRNGQGDNKLDHCLVVHPAGIPKIAMDALDKVN